MADTFLRESNQNQKLGYINLLFILYLKTLDLFFKLRNENTMYLIIRKTTNLASSLHSRHSLNNVPVYYPIFLVTIFVH